MSTIHQLVPRQRPLATACCALCRGPMRERYDAAPVRPDQFCCYHCAVKVVIPRRLDQLLRDHTQQEGAGRFSDGVAFELNNAVRREALETIATLKHLTWRVDATPAAS